MDNIAAKIQRHPDESHALFVDGRTYTYAELAALSGAISRALLSTPNSQFNVVAILSEKTAFAYSSIVGAHGAGQGYVPLNPKFPPKRLQSMLGQSKANAILLGSECVSMVGDLLDHVAELTSIIYEPGSDIDALAAAYPDANFIELGPVGLEPPRKCHPDSYAYILFTSGSTGTPKGVPVSFSNLDAYLNNVSSHVSLVPTDRCSQTFDLTFDLSVHDIFLTFGAGACLFPFDKNELIAPARFLRDQRLTVWFSVPTVAMLMQRTRTLSTGLFPSLRLSLFCGEALPTAIARAWSKAAPNSQVLNLYGPTEATIAITSFAFSAPQADAGESEIVPIGRSFEGNECALLNELDCEVVGPGRGELLLAGSQLTEGYLEDPVKTSAQFIEIPVGTHSRWYRTGDLVERDENGLLHYLGRIDSQIKFRGHRIELQEIDTALRNASRSPMAVSVPVIENGQVQAIIGVVPISAASSEEILTSCAATLPSYMVPSEIRCIETFPTNANGKIDRPAIASWVAES